MSAVTAAPSHPSEPVCARASRPMRARALWTDPHQARAARGKAPRLRFSLHVLCVSTRKWPGWHPGPEVVLAGEARASFSAGPSIAKPQVARASCRWIREKPPTMGKMPMPLPTPSRSIARPFPRIAANLSPGCAACRRPCRRAQPSLAASACTNGQWFTGRRRKRCATTRGRCASRPRCWRRSSRPHRSRVRTLTRFDSSPRPPDRSTGSSPRGRPAQLEQRGCLRNMDPKWRSNRAVHAGC